MKKCSLDTNCILALVLPDRSTQRDKVMRKIEIKECHVSDLVFSEVEFILTKAYELPRGVVVDNILAISNLEHINCNRNMLRQVLPVYEKHPALSFVDVCLAVQARLNDAEPLYTFDKKLASQMNETCLPE